MTKTAHYLTGIALSLATARYAALHAPLSSATQILAAGAGAVFGSTAPDWLEIAHWDRRGRRHSVIPHRTLTHWPLLWFGAGWYAWANLAGSLQLLVLAFVAGGLLHLACDILTPMGIPLLLPGEDRTSLHFFRSGDGGEFLVIMLSFLLAGGYALWA
jgi:membrane-bound metal-dependent hydrolase YbcI (DUF457 family)